MVKIKCACVYEFVIESDIGNGITTGSVYVTFKYHFYYL